MLNYVLALGAGVLAGFFLPSGFMSKPKSLLFNVSLIGLLFFMGVNLGRDQDLLSKKISRFGIVSGVMSLSVIFFSLVAVVILIKIFGEKNRNDDIINAPCRFFSVRSHLSLTY